MSSPASNIYALGRPIEFTSVIGECITQAEFSLKDWRSPFVRILVRDANERKAWWRTPSGLSKKPNQDKYTLTVKTQRKLRD